MSTKKQANLQRIAKLERELLDAKAAQVHNYHFADAGLDKASTKHFMASGVVITITALGGRELIPPTLLRNGLSDELIAALRADLRASYKEATVFKPRNLEAA